MTTSPTSYEDAAVATVVDAVAGLEHGPESGHGGVEADVMQPIAQ